LPDAEDIDMPDEHHSLSGLCAHHGNQFAIFFIFKICNFIAKILKCFRQSVLAAACSGRLTSDWRDKNADVSSVLHDLKRILKVRKDSYANLCLTAKRYEKPKPRKPIYLNYEVDNDVQRLPDLGEVGLPLVDPDAALVEIRPVGIFWILAHHYALTGKAVDRDLFPFTETTPAAISQAEYQPSNIVGADTVSFSGLSNRITLGGQG